jgi:hypothetical protein
MAVWGGSSLSFRGAERVVNCFSKVVEGHGHRFDIVDDEIYKRGLCHLGAQALAKEMTHWHRREL